MNPDLKSQIHFYLTDLLKERIDSASKEIERVKESRNSETKSSMGDKYETGRAMAQLEIDKAEKQLHDTLELKRVLAQINPEKNSDQVELGSLVQTAQGVYFISIGLGAVDVNGQQVFCISLASPIGKVLFSKKQNDTIEFQGRMIKIEAIY